MNLEQLRKQAKELVRAARGGDTVAFDAGGEPAPRFVEVAQGPLADWLEDRIET